MGSEACIQPQLWEPVSHPKQECGSTVRPSPASGWQCLVSARTMRSCHNSEPSGLGSTLDAGVPRRQLLSPSKGGVWGGRKTSGYREDALGAPGTPWRRQHPDLGNKEALALDREGRRGSAGSAHLIAQQLSAEHLGQM